jgi:hypothetical protein
MESLEEVDSGTELTRARHRLRGDGGYRAREEVMELIESVCEDETEREAVRLEAEGYTQKEAAERLKLSTPYLSKAMKRLGLRFGAQERLLNQ